MPFVDVKGLTEVQEADLVPEGVYQLRIFKAEDKEPAGDKRGMTAVSIEVLNPPNGTARPIFHNVLWLKDGDPDKTKNFILLQNRRFLELFEIPFEESGFNSDDFVGQTAECRVVKASYQDSEGKTQFKNELDLPELKKRGK